jgi:molybdopterin/thiamine biosynthesis adenylyltransferase
VGVAGQRAEASLDRIRVLNALVQVDADTESLADKPEAFFEQFSLVCLTDCPLALQVPPLALFKAGSRQPVSCVTDTCVDCLAQVKVNEICRKKSIPFYSAETFGMDAMFFCDLSEHQFVR